MWPDVATMRQASGKASEGATGAGRQLGSMDGN